MLSLVAMLLTILSNDGMSKTFLIKPVVIILLCLCG